MRTSRLPSPSTGECPVRAAGYKTIMSRSTAILTARRLQLDIATAIRDTRRSLGWSQRELARRCGLAQATVSNIERCDGQASIGVVAAVLDVLSIRPELHLRTPFVDRRPQGDAVHHRCLTHVARRLEGLGWIVSEEVEVEDGRLHGWIDILAFDRSSGTVIVAEIKTELHDLGEIERTMGWYERLAWRASARLGWRPRSVVGVLLVLATDAVEARIAENRDAIRRTYAVRGIEIQAWLDQEPRPPLGGRGLALIDPGRRGKRWAWSSAIDGSRMTPPFRDYAEAARALTRRPRGIHAPGPRDRSG